MAVSPQPDPFADAADVLRLPPDTTSIREARDFVSAVIDDWGETAVADLAVATSEVVTNAVVHARGPVALRVQRHDGYARVEVHDSDPAPPVVRPHQPARPGGRGLRLVDALSDCWGVTNIEHDGKIVWFDIELQPRQ